jgi:zinc protease
VLEERRMRVDNVPAELLDEAVREQLFGRHKPYAMPTAGYADDVEKTQRRAISRAFYRATTHPTTPC